MGGGGNTGLGGGGGSGGPTPIPPALAINFPNTAIPSTPQYVPRPLPKTGFSPFPKNTLLNVMMFGGSVMLPVIIYLSAKRKQQYSYN
jgi:hypothetical protein